MSNISIKCKVTNGIAQYRITGFQEYQGKLQVTYRKVIPATLEFFPDTVGSWMDFTEAESELKIIKQN